MWAALFYLRKGRNDLLRPYHEGRNHHGQRKDHRLLLQDVSAGTGLNRAGDGGGGYPQHERLYPQDGGQWVYRPA